MIKLDSIKKWTILFLLVLVGFKNGAMGMNGAPPLVAGQGIWLRHETRIIGNEACIVSNLKSYGIKHVFLFSVGLTSIRYAQYGKFLQTAHANNLTVHAICANNLNVGITNVVALQNAIDQVVIYNDSTNVASRFDGVQMDVEGATGPALLALMRGVNVPSSLVFSAAVQPDEFAPKAATPPYGIESYYSNMVASTSLDLLIPMIYIMDGLAYSETNLVHCFCVMGNGSDTIAAKTSEMLARIPSNAMMMIGLSGYDYEAAIRKTGGPNWSLTGGWWGSEMAFSSGPYAVPFMSRHFPLVSVNYQVNTGISTYRFDYNGTNWWDVNEMTPIGFGLSIVAANRGGMEHSNYMGTVAFLYSTFFDSTSGRRWGMTLNNTNKPLPQVGIQVLDIARNLVTLKVSLTNGNPCEPVLGDSDSTGVYLELPSEAAFWTADPGAFHVVSSFNGRGDRLDAIRGARVLELRKFYFDNLSAQWAQSGLIQVSNTTSFVLHYRAWMTAKTSFYTNNGSLTPFIVRSPADAPYRKTPDFANYATHSINITMGTNVCATTGN